jgi:hypothetical protein
MPNRSLSSNAAMGQVWRLAYLLPNLQLASRFELDGLAFVPNEDARLTAIRNSNNAARALLDGVRDTGGHKLNPAAVIYRSPARFRNLMAAIVDARNCMALACVLNGWQLSVGQLNNFYIRDSDYFDFYPRWPSDDGQKFCYEGPSLGLVSNVPANFTAQAHPYILPGGNFPHSRAEPDVEIYSQLCDVWRRIHVSGTPQAADYRRLRSVSVAYEACRVPQAMDHPLYDHGKHCSFWVSALETLAHPSRRKVTLEQVMWLLERRRFRDARIRKRRVIIIRQARRKSDRKRMPVNSIQRLYKRLYDCRNAFLHGNTLSIEIFIPPELCKGVRLLDVAPLIYLAALEAELNPRIGHPGRPTKKLTVKKVRALIKGSFRHDALEDAFRRAMGLDSV